MKLTMPDGDLEQVSRGGIGFKTQCGLTQSSKAHRHDGKLEPGSLCEAGKQESAYRRGDGGTI